MKTNTQHTGGQESDTLSAARKAVESAISQLTTIKHEPQAADVRSGERLGWLLDDLLRARLELEILDDEPELQGGIPHEVDRADGARVAENSENRVAGEPGEDRPRIGNLDVFAAFEEATANVQDAMLTAMGNLERAIAEAVRQFQAPVDGASGGKAADSHVPAEFRGILPCDHRDADAYLAKGEEALATCLEVDGQEFVDDESGALLSRSLTRAWSAVRMARLELRPSKGGDQ